MERHSHAACTNHWIQYESSRPGMLPLQVLKYGSSTAYTILIEKCYVNQRIDIISYVDNVDYVYVSHQP